MYQSLHLSRSRPAATAAWAIALSFALAPLGRAQEAKKGERAEGARAGGARTEASRTENQTTTAPEFNSRIRDEARMFSERTVENAQSALKEIERKHRVPVLIETIESLQGVPIEEAARDRARRSGSQGIFILMSKKDRLISKSIVSRRLQSRIDNEKQTEIRDAFVGDFRKGRFDDGLREGISTIDLVLAKSLEDEARTSEPFNPARPGSKPDPSATIESASSDLIVRDRAQLTLAGARKILDAAEAKAFELKVKENIAVVDDGGHLIAFVRMDGARPASVTTATTKAVSAATFRQATGPMPAGSANPDPLHNLGIENAAAASGGKITTLKGGVPIVLDGQVIGAVGVGGASGDQDVEVAKAGIEAFLSVLKPHQADRDRPRDKP